MAKKNTNKAKQQPKTEKKTTTKTSPAATDEVVFEETPAELETPALEITTEELETPFFDQNSDGPIEIFFELGEEEPGEQIEDSMSTTQEKIDSAFATAQPKKVRQTKLGTDAVAKLAGCSYHFFRKYFKKRFAEEGIKVRFVKDEKSYNGHMEIAETDIERAKGIILELKAEDTDVKKLFWFV